MEKKILDLVKTKGPLRISYCLNKDTVIIDFYNVYCNYIKFDMYRTFTLDTFKSCLENICNTVRNKRLIVVSKNIFEVSDKTIVAFTKKFKNLTYIMVKDEIIFKTQNRERDDFMCLVLNKRFDKSFIISNDRFSNLKDIILNIKPFKLVLFKNGELAESSLSLTELQILKTELLKDFCPLRKNFTFPIKNI